jgi:hypothetical protein
MIRDPRDRYQASIEKWPRGKGRAGGAAARWNYSTALAERHQREHPDDFMIVRFEDLITDTEATVRAVCAFLGEDFHEGMLTMAGAPTHRERIMGDFPGPVRLSPDYIGRFRGRVAPAEVLYIQTHARAGMGRYGYEPEPISLTSGQRLRYRTLVEPNQYARGLTWLAVEAGQQRFPRLVPRRPGRRMIVAPAGG